MAFSADELRVLRRALAIALHPSTADDEDVSTCLRLAHSVDEAVHESARLRDFLLADLARYRAALPGTVAGYLPCWRKPSAPDTSRPPTTSPPSERCAATRSRPTCSPAAGSSPSARSGPNWPAARPRPSPHAPRCPPPAPACTPCPAAATRPRSDARPDPAPTGAPPRPSRSASVRSPPPPRSSRPSANRPRRNPRESSPPADRRHRLRPRADTAGGGRAPGKPVATLVPWTTSPRFCLPR